LSLGALGTSAIGMYLGLKRLRRDFGGGRPPVEAASVGAASRR
jgi:hypothetical protein